ncbi:MAG TPA: sortase [Candidatus Nanoarchaeia archaeon]
MNKRKRFWIFIAIRTIANSLVIVGIVFSFLSFAPFVKQEIWYWWRASVLQVTETKGVAPDISIPKAKAEDLPVLKVEPKSKEFGIVIEKIGVNAPVVPNVNAANYPEYIAALSKGVAHAAGTAVPGSTKATNNNVFLFAHSAINAVQARRYNSVFYLLRKLEKGDRVATFYKGKRYDYIAVAKKVTGATDVRYLTNPSKKPILTLQTCDPPGSSLRRLIITAELVR